MTSRLLPLAVAAAALGVAAGVALHLVFGASAAPAALALPTMHGQANWLPGKRRAPGFELPDQNGRLVSLRAQRGHAVVLAFMDPLCKRECPTEGRELGLAEQQLAPAQRSALLIVSVDPLATGADAKHADAKWHIPANAHWLLGDPEQLAAIWHAYGITVVGPTGGVHSTAIYLIDREGDERAGFVAPFLPQFVADDLRTLASAA